MINRGNGDAMEMNFDDEQQKQRWLEINPRNSRNTND